MQRYNNNVQGPNGQAIVGAAVVVTVAANPAGTGAPAIVYSDDGITQISNTLLTDALGRFGFYVPSGKYDLSFSGGSPLIAQPYVLANVEITDHLEFQILDATPLAAEVLNFTELAVGPTPAPGSVNLYTKTADKLMYYKNDAGIEVGPLGSGSGGSPPAGSTGAVQINNTGVFGAGPQVSTVAIKPQTNDHIQYVSPNGNDSNDGFSTGSAKLTVYAALQALPGGSSTTAGNGTIYLTGTVSYGGPVPTQGMWLMGGGDPNFASPPAGWLKFVGAPSITIDCLSTFIAAAHGHTGHCGLIAGNWTVPGPYPAVWISDAAGSITLNNFAFAGFANTYVRYGIDSNNNRNGSGGSSGLALKNLAMNNGNCSGSTQLGPSIDIGSNSFWIWMKELTIGGCPKEIFTVASSGAVRTSGIATITTTIPSDITTGELLTVANVTDDSFNGSFSVTVIDNQHFTYNNPGPNTTSGTGQVITARSAAINIDSGNIGTGSGLIFIDDTNLNNGNIRFRPGTSGGGVYIRNVSYEGASGLPDPPTVLITSVQNTGTGGGQIVRVDNVEVSDASNAVSVVEVDNASNFPDATIVSRIAGPIRGQMTVLGGVVPVGTQSNLSKGQFGLQEGQITATGIDVARRGFSPVAALGTNIATTNPASWSFNTGSGTITPGFPAPDGTNNAGRVTGSGQAFVQFYGNTTNLNLGDVYVFGIWARAVNGQFAANPPIKFTFNSLGQGAGDACFGYPGTGPGNGLIIGNRRGGFVSDGQWQWYSGLCKVAANPTTPGTSFNGQVSSTSAADFYAPVMLLFPAGTKSDNETWEIANNLSTFQGNMGEVAMLPSQLFRPGSTAFANLGTPANGVFIYCSDCNIANPCTGGGTGALAKRLGGIWVCN